MKKVTYRATVRPEHSQQDFVAWWTTGMWILAAAYLIATFRPL